MLELDARELAVLKLVFSQALDRQREMWKYATSTTAKEAIDRDRLYIANLRDKIMIQSKLLTKDDD